MRHALDLARKGWGDTHPNPMVGAVIVDHGEIVARGWHERAGAPHAEVNAFADLRARGVTPSPDATLYLTLEPCSTEGRTPPCTEAILASGVRHVVVATTDPNPLHAGRGLAILRDRGLNVELGLLGDEAAELNLLFHHWIVRKQPLIAAKVATTLDGRTATRTGLSQWISSPESRADVHRWRRLFPAIAVGAETVLADDPALTSRREGYDVFCPRRLILDPDARTLQRDPLPRVFTDEFAEQTLLLTRPDVTAAPPAPVSHETLPLGEHGFEAHAFRARCVEKGLIGVYLETGARTLGLGLASGLIDYLFLYQAPILLGDDQARPMASGPATPALTGAWRLTHEKRETHGCDLLRRGFIESPGI